jgi:cyclopropane fatty-acyl-phospholipid synthase-like methyltransferase
MLQAYRPSARFHGVDPIREAVEWAAAEIKGSMFAVSQQSPPLNYPDESFDGVMAVSIWSHFGEREALAWFDEVYRCLKPGGWLFLTTHGLLSVYRHCFLRIHPPERVKALFEGLLNSDYVFEEKYVGQSPEGLDVQGWGNAYILRSWFVRNLADKWNLSSCEPGANQSNQDIYVLTRR